MLLLAEIPFLHKSHAEFFAEYIRLMSGANEFSCNKVLFSLILRRYLGVSNSRLRTWTCPNA
jgi:hypothetical protein